MASPTDIFFATGGTIREAAPAGTVVGTLAALDDDVGDTFTFVDAGVPQSTVFEIVGNQFRLRPGATLDYETLSSYTILVQVTDSTGNVYQETITITVSDGNEITGTSGNDQGAAQINGTLGNDIIDALAGHDVVLGDAGDDTIYGRAGSDNLQGGFGADTIYGGTENDSISGQSGTDMLYGEDGDDNIDSGGGGGTMDGGAGNDSLYVGTNSSDPFETLIGGDGNDTIYNVGYRRADVVDAGADNDRVFVYGFESGGTATVTLGSGSDTITPYDYAAIYNYGNQANVTDFATGAGGDKIDIAGLLNNLSGYGGSNPFGTGFLRLVQSGADTLLQVDNDASGTGYSYITILTLQNTAATSFTADNFSPAWPPDGSNPAGQTITGTSGNDQGAAQINGTLGNDIIDALAGHDVVLGDAGDDTIYGRAGSDNLQGGFGADTIYGGTENDSISGQSGTDMLYGEDGDDNIDSGGGGGTMDGGAGNDSLYVGTNSSDPFETLIGGDGNDTIYNVGYRRADVVDAGADNDRVFVYGFESGGTATVTLGSGSDTITPYDYAAIYNYGNQANVTDFATGAGGDKIDIAGLLNNLSGYGGSNPFGTGFLRLVQSGADTLLQVDNDASGTGYSYITILTLQNTAATSFTADNFSPAWPPDGSNPAGQTITGTSGNDQGAAQINGTLGNDIIDALAGHDVVLGDAGDDTIYGRAGSDNLQGGFGADTIYGGTENDSISGQSGTDMLYGEDGDDNIDSGGGGGTMDGGAGNDSLYVGTNSSDPFETLIGGDGNDTIYNVGYRRADVVDAGADNDRVFVYGFESGGTATVTLGSGSDTITPYDYAAIYNYGNQANVTDFATGAGGDKIDIAGLLNNLSGYGGSNPFGTGFLRLVQSGADTLLQVDNDASGTGYSYITILTLQNTAATSFTADNFSPAWPPSINLPPEASIGPTSFASTEQTSINLKNAGLSVADADGNNLVVTLSVGQGTLSVTAGSSGASVSGSGTAVVTVTGTASQINELLSPNATSTVSYLNSSNTPPASTTLTLQVSDGGNTASDTATINITSVNDAPTGAPTATLAGGTEDVSYVVSASDLLTGFSDVDGDTLSVANLVSSSGTATNNGDGTYTISAPANANGLVTLTYDVSDGNGGTLTGQTRSFTRAAVNDAPTGAPTATLAGGAEDVAYVVNAGDLLAGFSDVDGDTLSVANLASSSGTVTNNGNGTFTISAPANANGLVTLTYDVTDGNGGTLTGQTRSFTRAAVNDAPDVSGPVTGTATEDGSPVTLGALANATDVDTANLTVVNVPATLPDGVTFAATSEIPLSNYLSISVPVNSHDANSAARDTGIWSVTAPFNVTSGIANLINPAPAFYGQFVIHDHVYVAPYEPDPSRAIITFEFATPTIVDQVEIVEHANGITKLHGYVGNSLGSLMDIGSAVGSFGDITGPGIMTEFSVNTFDFDNTIAATFFQVVLEKSSFDLGYALYRLEPEQLASAFTLDPSHASYQYLGENELTVVTVNYGVSDGFELTPASVSWTVFGVNDAPTVVNGLTASLAAVAEDTTNPAGETVASVVGSHFNDVDTSDVFGGIAVMSNAATGAEGSWQYFNGSSWVGVGSPSVSSALQLKSTDLVRFVPAADFNGSVPALTVRLIDDSISFATGSTANVTTAGGATPYSTGTLSIGTMVTEVNDEPTATYDTLSSVTEDSGTRIISFASLTANDSNGPANESGQSLAITALSNIVGGTAVINGTNVEFSPTANFNGTASFDYTVEDNGSTNGVGDFKSDIGSASFSLTPVNDAPTATNLNAAETYTEDMPKNLIDIVVNDVDSTTVTATLTLSNTAAGSLSTATSGAVTSAYVAGTGVWMASGPTADVNALLAGVTFTPAANFFGNFAIATSISDGVAAAITGSKSMTGTPVNDAPTVANAIANQSATEDTAFNFQFAATTFADADVGDTLTYTAQLAGGGTLPSWLSFDPVTRTFSGTPLNSHVGTTSIDVIADDGNGGTATDTFNIVIANTNDAPTGAPTTTLAGGTEDVSYVVNASDLLAGFSDVDGDTLSVANLVSSERHRDEQRRRDLHDLGTCQRQRPRDTHLRCDRRQWRLAHGSDPLLHPHGRERRADGCTHSHSGGWHGGCVLRRQCQRPARRLLGRGRRHAVGCEPQLIVGHGHGQSRRHFHDLGPCQRQRPRDTHLRCDRRQWRHAHRAVPLLHPCGCERRADGGADGHSDGWHRGCGLHRQCERPARRLLGRGRRHAVGCEPRLVQRHRDEQRRRDLHDLGTCQRQRPRDTRPTM